MVEKLDGANSKGAFIVPEWLAERADSLGIPLYDVGSLMELIRQSEREARRWHKLMQKRREVGQFDN